MWRGMDQGFDVDIHSAHYLPWLISRFTFLTTTSPRPFQQPKYHPNVISCKAYRIGPYSFIPMGLTFEDCSSPPSFEPIVRARMALSSQPSKIHPACPRLSRVYGPGYVFTTTTAGNHVCHSLRRPIQPGCSAAIGRASSFSSADFFSMHADDWLYTTVGKPWMHVLQCRWTRRHLGQARTVLVP